MLTEKLIYNCKSQILINRTVMVEQQKSKCDPIKTDLSEDNANRCLRHLLMDLKP